jgi:uncharacterized lipoprotein
MHYFRAVLYLSLCLSVAGCGSLFKATCAKPGDFASAVDNPPLRIPAGLDPPDTRAALTIPPLQTPEAPRPADAPCIDLPPVFNPAPPKRPQA